MRFVRRNLPDDPVAVLRFKVSKLGEVDRLGSSGLEIGVEEGRVTNFIQRVAGDILWAIRIEVRQGYLIVIQRLTRVGLNGWIIADTTQFRILCPQVRLDQFGRRQKP